MSHTKLEQLAYGLAAAQALCFDDSIGNDWYAGYCELVDADYNDRDPVGFTVWEPLENRQLGDILDRVDNEAQTILHTMKQALALAKAGIVDTACNDELSLDMNELDMVGMANRGGEL